jgi:hypothetical protein
MPRLHLDRTHGRARARLKADLHLFGGLLFVAGSLLFFPGLQSWQPAGTLTFLAGSLLFLTVTAHDLAEARRRRVGVPGETAAGAGFLGGAAAFLCGDLLFLSGLRTAAAAAWLAGSLLFFAAGVLHMPQIARVRSRDGLVLAGLASVAFVGGALLFASASAPFLWLPHTDAPLRAYLAVLFLFGSLLFVAGSVLVRRRVRG